MKKRLMVVISILVAGWLSGEAYAQPTAKENKWFSSQNWLPGIRRRPSGNIDRSAFAKQYRANKAWWDTAFSYIMHTNLAALKPGRYTVYGNDDVYVNVTDAAPKNKKDVLFEAHRHYADIHCVVSGKELIGIAPYAGAIEKKAYDPAKDIAFYTAPAGKYYESSAATLFIMFPEKDAHCGGIRVHPGDTTMIKKVVLKVRTTE